MAKSEEKMKALALRRKGESVKGIAKKLSVSPCSVSIWTRDIVLTKKQRDILTRNQILAGHKGRIMGAESNKAKKQSKIFDAQQEALDRIPHITSEDLYNIGLGLYWGEGSKAEKSSVAVVNSDPRVIKLMMKWFAQCWGVDTSRFEPRVFISDIHRDREEVIIRYWMKTLGIPRSQFRKMIFLNRGKKIYENRNVYYGVLTLRIAKSAELKYRILASIDRVAEVVNAPA